MLKMIFLFIQIVCSISVLVAGTNGKIMGVIQDLDNGEPLPGVNIQIKGTLLGASTDIDGYYVILNAPVGTHELLVSYIGYQDISLTNVLVSADATSRYDFKMKTKILESNETIRIVAEKKLIKLDNTASQTVIPSELMAAQPVDNVTQTVALTAGYTGGSFRGGRVGRGEVKYLLDGVDISSPLGYTFTGFNPGQGSVAYATDIPESSIEEVQVITGGMDPQYDSKSAVINIVSKSRPASFSGFTRIRMSPSLYGNGGIIPHGFGQVNGFMTDAEAIAEAKRVGTGSIHRNETFYSSPSKSFVNRNFRRYEAGIGGPVEMERLTGSGKLSFNLNVDIFNTGGFYRGQKYNKETVFAKLNYQMESSKSLSLNFLSSHQKSRIWTHKWSRIVTTGDTIFNYREGSSEPGYFLVGSVVHPDGRLEAVKNYDMLDNLDRPESWSNLMALTYRNVVSSNTFYEVKISRFKTAQKIRVFDPATGKPLGMEDFADRRIANPTHADYFPEGAPLAFGVAESYWRVQPMRLPSFRQDDEQVVWSFVGNLRSQINENNELRLGVEYKTYDLKFNYQSGTPAFFFTVSNYNVSPKKFALFATDKIETRGMIINSGLRLDYFDPNAILPENFNDPVIPAATDPNNPLYWDANAPAIDRIKNPKSAKSTLILMPRLGISFPISELDVVHINYGHYFGLPSFGEIYNNYSWALAVNSTVGNPELHEEKTISYEAGIEHGFNDKIKLTATFFYKDIADLVNFKKYYNNISGSPFWVKINADFANVLGFELSTVTKRWHNFLAHIAYTYQIAKGKSSYSSSAYYDDDNGRRLRTESFPLDWDIRHTVTANIDYRVPQNWLDNKWLGDWGTSVILKYRSGKPYTSPQQTPPPGNIHINDERYPDWLNVDMRIFKNFPVWENIRIGTFVEIYNVFNDRTLLDIIHLDSYHNGEDDGDGTRNNPSAWATPRNYRLGFEIFF